MDKRSGLREHLFTFVLGLLITKVTIIYNFVESLYPFVFSSFMGKDCVENEVQTLQILGGNRIVSF